MERENIHEMTLQYTLGDYILRDCVYNGTWIDASYDAVAWHSVRSYQPTITAIDQIGNLYTIWVKHSTGQRCPIPRNCDQWRKFVEQKNNTSRERNRKALAYVKENEKLVKTDYLPRRAFLTLRIMRFTANYIKGVILCYVSKCNVPDAGIGAANIRLKTILHLERRWMVLCPKNGIVSEMHSIVRSACEHGRNGTELIVRCGARYTREAK